MEKLRKKKAMQEAAAEQAADTAAETAGEAADALTAAAAQAADTAVETAGEAADALTAAAAQAAETAAETSGEAADALTAAAAQAAETAAETSGETADALTDAGAQAAETAAETAGEAADAFTDAAAQAAETGPAGSEKKDDDLFAELLQGMLDSTVDQKNGEVPAEDAHTPDTEAGPDPYAGLAAQAADMLGEDAGEGPDSDEKETSGKAGESEGGASAQSDDDLLLAAFGYSAAGAAAVPSDGGKRNGSLLKKRPESGRDASNLDGAFAYDGREYKSRSQKGDILYSYDREKRLMNIRLIGSLVFAVLLLIYDIFGSKFGGALSAADYPAVNIMISLQLLLICAVFSIRDIVDGIKGILRADPVPTSLTATVFVFTVLYDILLAVAAPKDGFTLYNSPAAFCLFTSVLAGAAELYRQAENFKRISSWDSVCTLEHVGGDAPRTAGDTAASGTGVYRLTRSRIASGFFRHTNRSDPRYRVLNYVIAPVVALALILMIITLAGRKHGFSGALNVFMVVIQFSMPTFAIAADLIPFLALCFRRLDRSTVFLNRNDPAEYDTVKSVVLDETDMFSEGSLKIGRVRMCSPDADIYSVMTDTSAICSEVGGTISTAFRRISDEADRDDSAGKNVVIDKVTDGGIDAYAGGHHYIIGSMQFLSGNGIACRGCDDGSYLSSTPGGVVLHIASDGVEAVRLYMQYLPGQSFAELIDSFSDSQIKVELHCIDPNINGEFVSAMLGGSKVEVIVVRDEISGGSRVAAGGDAGERESVSEGLLADGDEWMSVIEAAGVCRTYKAATKLNFYILAGFAVLGVLLATFLGIFGASIGMSALYILLFRVLAAVPSVLIAKMYIA